MMSFRAAAAFSRPALCRALLALAILPVGACSLLPNWQIIYRPDIEQGTVITQEMVAQLRPGMTREQVRFVLGTPAFIDPFHAGRWDYDYRYQPGRGDVVERRFAVFFENDRMVKTEGDPLPTEQEFIADRLRLNYIQNARAGVGNTAPPPLDGGNPAQPPSTSTGLGSGPGAPPPSTNTPSSGPSSGTTPVISVPTERGHTVSPDDTNAAPPATTPSGASAPAASPAPAPTPPQQPTIWDRIKGVFNRGQPAAPPGPADELPVATAPSTPAPAQPAS